MVRKVNPDDGKTLVSTQGHESSREFSGKHPCPTCGLEVPLSVTKCPQDGTVIADTLGEGRKLVGNYEFLEFIGSGGMGVIYKARHPVLKRLVAVKMLHSHLMNEMIVKRFQHEAQAVSSLSHANIIAVHDFGLSEHGQPYMVMDFIDGKPLSEVLKQGPMGLVPVINIAIQIAEGLQHAHEHGVLHRDLKPSNIMVTDADCDFPEAKIVDFGIAKIMETNSTRVTQTGELIGTPQYMSPEQCRGGELDARSDVYALGCVMFEAITGKPPFSGESMVSVIVDQISKPARSLGEVRPDIQFPLELEDLIAKTLTKEPVDRFQSMNAFLQEAIEVQKIVAQREKRKKTMWRFLKLNRDQRHLLLLSIAASFTLIGVASSAVLMVKTVQHEALKKLPPPASAVPLLVNRPPEGVPEDVVRQIAKDRVDLFAYVDRNLIDDEMLKRFLYKDIGLKVLNLRDSKITDEGLLYVARQQGLRQLHLANTKITDKGLRTLQDLKWLNELNVDKTLITSSGMEYLSKLPNLIYLSISWTKVDNAGLEQLSNSHLLKLHLRGNKIDAKSLQLVSQIKSLELLNVAECKNIPDSAYAQLAKLAKLQTLWLESTDTSDSTIPYINKIKTLTELELVDTSVTINGVKQLAKLPNLVHLKYRGQPIDPSWVTVLARFPRLILLGFSSTNIDDATLAAIARQMPKVENIDLENCKSVTDAGLASIRKLKRLYWTKVSGTSVTPAAVEAFKKHPPTPTSTIN